MATSNFRSRSGKSARAILREFADATADRVDEALTAGLIVAVAATKETLSTPGQGRLYPRGKKRKHRASRPGDPPAPDTGTLRNSIAHELTGRGAGRWGSSLEYAQPLEDGTIEDGGALAPRPFMAPTLARAEAAITEAVVDTLKRGAN